MGHTPEFYFSQTLGRPLDDCGWKDIHETSFSLIKILVGKKNAVLADSFERDCIVLIALCSLGLFLFYCALYSAGNSLRNSQANLTTSRLTCFSNFM